MYKKDGEQQKIFVDGEEEITTVVDHLRRCQARYVILVVPQHAVLLQSIVNLKLLAQEARRMQKNIMIMTNDEGGITFAERAGIMTKQYSSQDQIPAVPVYDTEYVRQGQSDADHIMPEKHLTSSEQSAQMRTIGFPVMAAVTQPARQSIPASMQDSKKANASITTYDYNGNPSVQRVPQQKQYYQPATRNANVANHAVHSVPQMQQSVPQYHAVREDALDQYEKSLYNNAPTTSQGSEMMTSEQYRSNVNKSAQRDSAMSQKGYGNSAHTKHKTSFHQMKNGKHDNDISPKTRTLVKGFVIGGIILVILIGLVIFLPKSHITVTPKNVAIDDNVDLTIRTDQSAVDIDRRILPARMIERDITYTKSFDATGSGDVGAQKAQGKIMIYNAFDSNPQSLVATTRFLSENGVLFRLVNTTVIPGMQNGEPGKVEALVIADQEGVEGNIDSGRFSIPGFDPGPKKDKIYGISEQVMTGGGTGGNGVAIVTKEDIARAQKEMESEIGRYVQDQVTALLRPESEVLLPDAINVDIVRSESSVSEDTMKEEFMYEVVAHVRAMVFMEDDVLAVIQDVFSDDLAAYNVEDPDIKLAYQNIVANFDEQITKMSVHGSTVITALVDLTSFKKDIVGKRHDDLLPVIQGQYENTIEKITIQSVVPSVPDFIAGRVSPVGVMTDLDVEE